MLCLTNFTANHFFPLGELMVLNLFYLWEFCLWVLTYKSFCKYLLCEGFWFYARPLLLFLVPILLAFLLCFGLILYKT